MDALSGPGCWGVGGAGQAAGGAAGLTSPAPKACCLYGLTPSWALLLLLGLLSPGAACNTSVSTELPDRAPLASALVRLCGSGLEGAATPGDVDL